VVFNQKSRRFARGYQGRLAMVPRTGVIIEVAGKVRRIKPRHIDQFTICRRSYGAQGKIVDHVLVTHSATHAGMRT
jgi:hypothetical protein